MKHIYRKILVDAWSQLKRAPANQIDGAFALYCRCILDALRGGSLGSQEAGVCLAQAMFLPVVCDDNAREAITQYAGELEMLSADSDQAIQNWQRIESLVLEISRREKPGR